MRTLALTLLAVAFGFGLAAADSVKKDVKKGAQETKEATKDAAKATKHEVRDDVKGAIHKATGTVKSVSADSLVLTDEHGKELSFELDKDTVIQVKGVRHKMMKADGTPTAVSELLSAKDHVSVRYSKPDDRMVAKDVHVTP